MNEDDNAIPDLVTQLEDLAARFEAHEYSLEADNMRRLASLMNLLSFTPAEEESDDRAG